jgi:hypothetical protein
MVGSSVSSLEASQSLGKLGIGLLAAAKHVRLRHICDQAVQTADNQNFTSGVPYFIKEDIVHPGM